MRTPKPTADADGAEGASAASTIPTGGRTNNRKPNLERLEPRSLASLLADPFETGSPRDDPGHTLKTLKQYSQRLTRTTTQAMPITIQAAPYLSARSTGGSLPAPSVDGDRRGSGAEAGGGDNSGGGGGGGGSGDGDGGDNGSPGDNAAPGAYGTARGASTHVALDGFDSGFDAE